MKPRILIIGLPYFSKKLSADLNQQQDQILFIALNTYYRILDKLLFFILLPFAIGVISLNGSSKKSLAFEWTLFMKKKLMIFWQGSDVLSLLKQPLHQYRYFNSDHILNLTDSEGLHQELSHYGLITKVTQFKSISIQSNLKIAKKRQILCYLGQNKEVFYGVEYLIELAQSLPEWQFIVVGSKNEIKLPNIISLGWVHAEKMNSLYQESFALLRATQHDGQALSVIEALSSYCLVLWTQKHPLGIYFNGKSELIEKGQLLNDRFNKIDNTEYIHQVNDWLLKNHHPQLIAKNLIQLCTHELKPFRSVTPHEPN